MSIVQHTGLQLVDPLADQPAIQRLAVTDVQLTEGMQHVIADIALIVMSGTCLHSRQGSDVAKGKVPEKHGLGR